MKKIVLLLTGIVLLFSTCRKDLNENWLQNGETLSQSASVPGGMPETIDVPKYAPNQLLVKFKNGIPDQAFLRQQKSVVKEKLLTAAMKTANYSGFHILYVPDVEQAVSAFKRNPNVEWVNPNWTVKRQAYAPNDPYYTGNNLWGMGNIKAPTAWNTNTGDQKVFVGIIDEGIMYWHEDLCGQIWQNPYETENGIDDDGNGYIDDMNGWDFMHNDKTIFDNYDNHGTHVAGTIGGIGNNSKGVVGVSPNVTMISGKFLEGSGYTSDAVRAVDYMTDLKTRHGMNIATTSNSWGGDGYDQALYDAINRAKAQNILFVAAAGNNGQNADISPMYPAAYNLDNIISVAAYNSSETLPYWTNYGATTVDIGAPGVNIISTLPGSQGASTYNYYSGTSMATPHVAGAVALYKAGNPTATYTQVKNAILNSARPITALTGKCVTGGVLNVESFITPTTNPQVSRSCVVPPIDYTPPTAPTNFRVVSMDSIAGTATLSWTASTDNIGVTSYRLAVPYSWYTAIWTLPGTTVSKTIDGLVKGVRYACELNANDAWNNQSPKAYLTFDFFGYDNVPPTTPGNFRVVGIKPTAIAFGYDWSTDNYSGVGLYRISYRRYGSGSSFSGWHTNGVNPLEVPNLATGVQYEFTMAAKDNNGNWSPETSPAIIETPRDIADATPPTTPTLSVSGKSLNSVSLNWTASTDNVGVMAYRVYYKSSSGSTYTLYTTTINRTATVSGLSNSTNYDFYVEAYDNAGNKTASNIVTQKTDGPSYTIATSLTGNLSKKTNQKLSWTSTISPTGYSIVKTELQNVQNGWWTTIYTQTTQSLTGTYTTIVNNRYLQQYRVVTTLASGEIGYSNTVGLTSQVR